MKQFLLFAFLSVFTLSLSAQVFVDADATGSGDGTSWADAYTNLNDALLAADSGASVWIADGTYTTPDTASFFIDKELTVLGGFNGTEADAGSADPATNVTILSGDVMGNDIAGVYDSMAYADNNRVLFIQDTNDVSAYTVTIDGLTFANGAIAADLLDGESLLGFSGGGLLTFARINASRLNFTANRANFGSAFAAIFNTADSSVIDDISLTGNFSSGNHQFYVNTVNAMTVSNSEFAGADGEQQATGFMNINFSLGTTIDNCNFSSMSTPAGRGAGLRAADCDRFLVRGCNFDGLNANLGGAVQVSQTGDSEPEEGETMGLDDYVFDSCNFTNNDAVQRGAAITSFNTNLNVTKSTFTDNRAGAIGGAFYMQPADGRSYVHNYTNTTISDNQDSGAGGAICMLVFGTADVTGLMDGNTVTGNISNGGQGGFAYLQGLNNFTVTNSEISENVAGFGTIISRGVVGLDVKNVTFAENGNSTDAYQGAGITIYFDPGSAGMTIDSSEFFDNTVSVNPNNIRSGGAALYLLGQDQLEAPVSITNTTFAGNAAANDTGTSGGAILSSSAINLSIDNSDFLDNSASGEGGAISIITGEFSRDTLDDVVTVINETFSGSITNSRFFNSIAETQGGAISTQQAAVDLINCVFVNNIANTASGGAIIFNGNAPLQEVSGEIREVGSAVLDANLVNNTFSGNSSNVDAFGDDIAIFQPGDENDADSNSIKLVLLNNAFFNPVGRASIEFEPGDDTVDGFVAIGNAFVESLGGNFYNTESDPTITLAATDITNEDIDATDIFVDIEDDAGEGPNADLVITDPLTDNPLINSGVVNALLPEMDVRGNPRGDFPDIGAYEAEQGAVSTGEPIENSGLDFTFFPNPTQDMLNIRNDEASIEQFTLIVADQNGRILKANRFSGTNSRVDFTNVPAGVYNLQIVVSGKIYSKQIVKQ